MLLREANKRKEIKVIITANMSAGKSTLVNALVGKEVALTSQEVCTDVLWYIRSKPETHIEGLSIKETIKYTKNELDIDEVRYITTGFKSLYNYSRNKCIIDTPGVNSSIHKDHGELSKKILLKKQYDVLVFVLNGNKLGTDEEVNYLKWVCENLSDKKIVFVLNKLDCFKNGQDDISTSINKVKKDLENIGFKTPVLCPISAYFGLLLKKKRYYNDLTDDEEDEYQLFAKRYSKEFYDLSKYYVSENYFSDDYDELSKKCGMYYLEKILFGG